MRSSNNTDFGCGTGRSRLRAGLLAWLAVCCLAGGVVAEEPPEAFLFRLKGMINEAYAETVKRKINYAVEQGAKVVILELDTPGGYVDSSQTLGDFIFKEVDIRTVAYINVHAYSGGTMVALACDEIYIDSAVGMMGDVAPISPSGEEMGEKQQSPIRTALVNYAEPRGYPTALVEAMVTKEIQVFRIHTKGEPPDEFQYVKGEQLEAMSKQELDNIDEKRLIVGRGRLLTLSAQDAVEYGFAQQAVSSRLELYDVLGLDPGRVVRLYMTGSERVLTILDTISPLLMVGGLILLFIELKSPGFGVPGVSGLVLLGSFFLIKYSLHYAHMLELLLFLIGTTLLLLELFVIPGFGVAGISGLCLLFVSLVLMMQQFTWPSSPSESTAFQFNLLQVIGAFIVTIVGLFVVARYMGSLPGLSRMIDRTTLASATMASPVKEGDTPLSDLVGESGIALTSLRPAGRAEFGGRPLDVVTEGEFVEKGTRVEVLGVHGQQVVVAPRGGPAA